MQLADRTPAQLRPAPIAEVDLARALAAGFDAGGLPANGGDPFGLFGRWADARVRAGLTPDFWDVRVRGEVVYGVAGDEGIAAAPQAGPARAVWSITLRIKPPDGGAALHAEAGAKTEAPFAGGDATALGAALTTQVEAAAREAAQDAITQIQVLGWPLDKLTAGITDAEPGVRRAAAERLGMMRAATAVPALAAQVAKEQDREVLLRMVGALAEIGDGRAADALIGRVNPRDRELLRAVVDALSVIGGARVDDFLSILATHDDADVRLLVEQAQARRKRGSSPP